MKKFEYLIPAPRIFTILLLKTRFYRRNSNEKIKRSGTKLRIEPQPTASMSGTSQPGYQTSY